MENLSFELIKRALFKRILLIAAITVLGAGAGVVVAMVIPPEYVSTARILVEEPQIPDEMVNSTVTSNANERLQVIEQRLMTRENLLELQARLGLFRDRPEMSPSDRVEELRRSSGFNRITIDRGRRRRHENKVSAFVLSYRSRDPATAARVTNEFVTLVLEQNLSVRQEQASGTREFFEEQVARLRQDLDAKAEELATFQQVNSEALPGGSRGARASSPGCRSAASTCAGRSCS